MRNRSRTPKAYPDVAAPPGVSFHVHELTKIYQMGKVEVCAFQSVDLDLYDVVLEALAQVNNELSTTPVLITHNAGIAAMANRVTMRSGKIIRLNTNDQKLSPLNWSGSAKIVFSNIILKH